MSQFSMKKIKLLMICFLSAHCCLFQGKKLCFRNYFLGVEGKKGSLGSFVPFYNPHPILKLLSNH